MRYEFLISCCPYWESEPSYDLILTPLACDYTEELFLSYSPLFRSLLTYLGVAACDPYTDADRAQKHGMDEFISANPCNFDHASLFELVQRLTLDHRLNDSYSCLVRLTHA